jgi:uncharacterized protein (DUF433 family)
MAYFPMALKSSLTIAPEKVPLETGADGVIRMHGSRVTLDSIVLSFQDGATAEEIAHQYPILALGDVYAAISYFLKHREEVNSYLDRRKQQHGDVRKQNEERFDPAGIRERLIARRSE